MNRIHYVGIVLLSFAFVLVWSDHVTPSVQCQGENFSDLRDRIQVVPCGKTRCKLRKGTNITVHFRFKPKHKTETLNNDVYANIAGIPLPFLGVTGGSACKQVTRADDGKPAPCPLAAGQEYTYTNVFPVESFYPEVGMIVHWSLVSDKGSVICFEVPAVIVPAKKQ